MALTTGKIAGAAHQAISAFGAWDRPVRGWLVALSCGAFSVGAGLQAGWLWLGAQWCGLCQGCGYGVALHGDWQSGVLQGSGALLSVGYDPEHQCAQRHAQRNDRQ